MPLKDFVHYSFAEALKANYVMAQGLPGLDDPVTMNLEKAVSSRAYYKLVTELLVARGIGTTFRDGVLLPRADRRQGEGQHPDRLRPAPAATCRKSPARSCRSCRCATA